MTVATLARAGSARARVALAFVAALALAIFRLLRTPPQLQLSGYTDFGSYYLYARVGLHQGWSALYQVDLQAREWLVMGGVHVIPWFPMIYPPPLAWIAVPFTLLPLPAAYAAWSLLLLGVLLLCWQLLMPAGPRLTRVTALLAVLALLPVAFALVLGQALVLVLGSVVTAWWLLERRRDVLAGIALSLLVLKPQVAFLVPLVLLIGGRRRTVATWLGCVTVIAVIAVLTTGIDGLRLYEARLASAAVTRPEFMVPAQYTLAGLAGTGLGLRIAEALGLLLALAVAVANRGRRVATLIAVGLVSSMLLTPYLHLEDLATLVVAGALAARGGLSRFEARVLAAGYLVLLGISLLPTPLALRLGPVLLLLEIAWLIGSWRAARPRRPSILPENLLEAS